jgi:hypothetical protein
MCTAGDGLWSTRPDCGAARGVIFISDRGFVVLDPGFFWFLGVIVVFFLVSETSRHQCINKDSGLWKNEKYAGNCHE